MEHNAEGAGRRGVLPHEVPHGLAACPAAGAGLTADTLRVPAP